MRHQSQRRVWSRQFGESTDSYVSGRVGGAKTEPFHSGGRVQTHCGSSLCRTAFSKPVIENDGESAGYLALISVKFVSAID